MRMPLLLCLLSVPAIADDKYEAMNKRCLDIVEGRLLNACAQKGCRKALACDNVCIEKYADDSSGTYESCRAKCWDKPLKGC